MTELINKRADMHFVNKTEDTKNAQFQCLTVFQEVRINWVLHQVLNWFQLDELNTLRVFSKVTNDATYKRDHVLLIFQTNPLSMD